MSVRMRLACVAGGIVGARNNKILAAGPLIYPLSKRYSARLQYRQLRRLVLSRCE